MEELKLGIIGLDTSHAVAFTKLLNNQKENHHVEGAKVVVAYPGGSPHMKLSMSRIEGFTRELSENLGVRIVDSIEEVVEGCDAILLESVDGGVHLEQFRSIVESQKPVFIDKPFALTPEDADEMKRLSVLYGTPIMSTSALRFVEGLQKQLHVHANRKIIGADCFGPMEIIEEQPGLFWYGIHTVEMLYTIMGCGVETVQTVNNDSHEIITSIWKDGRIGTIRGNRTGNFQFGATIHFEDGSEFVSITPNDKPFYASLLEQVVGFFQDKKTRIQVEETLEVIKFIHAANKSRGGAGEVIHL